MCMSSRKYTVLKMTGEFVALCDRVFKSFLFNCLVFGIAFCCGFLTMAGKVHFDAANNPKYESIQHLEQYLSEQRVLDNKIDAEIKELKHRIAHEKDPLCSKYPTKIFFDQIED